MTGGGIGGEQRSGADGAGADAGGRVVVVSGGARGIGLATARAFVAAGDRVAVLHRGNVAPEVAGGDVLAVRGDVTDAASVDAAFAEIEETLGPVEVAVANAGITADGLSVRMSDEDFTRVLDTNLTGAFRVARRAAQKMLRARRGRIVFVSSVVGSLGQAGQANYAASKAGLVGLARSMARELASRSVTVNVVAPGPIATDMLAAVGEERTALLAAAVPLGRLGTPEEVAAAIAFLASDAAAYITGVVLGVDGGLGMGGAA